MNPEPESCKICNSPSEAIFQKILLSKYNVHYFRCRQCGFIQTESPYWLPEAYSKVIADLDTGILDRNIFLSNSASSLILNAGREKGRFIDYGAGYGIFVRLMRDKGFDFHYYDKHPVNLFSGPFTHDPSKKIKYDLLTSFEVFEHLENPAEELSAMFALSDAILFSTEPVPQLNDKELSQWWYILPETGQHISFYTQESLRLLGNKYHAHYSSYKNLHLFAKEGSPFKLKKNIVSRLLNGLTRKLTHVKEPGINDFESLRKKTAE